MPKTKPVSRKHEVRAKLSVVELTKAGTSLDLEISADGERLGSLQIGRGSLYWRGAKRQRGRRVSWSQFAQQMDKLAYPR